MAARNRKGLSENTRLRIKTTMIVKRLEDHLLNGVQMTPSQIRAAEVLLNKTLPNLQSVESVVETRNQSANELTDEQLKDIAAGGSTGTTAEKTSTDKVH